ncbi:DUF5996 family protein [Lutimonas zeaxanthinifaciens]|uniref:DUF5996 family protein n=1 Tax=Lutimonas zeaxanthinifaciens TaxID=3060215 RepID=UPI00265D3686|nr:DUF5996 family protein [Lutimonas sp. YSD2104]WKK67145.1 DUF5996 family protein [Lutimonas sp. YSD2104]
MTDLKLPQLPYGSWTETRVTIHLILQIMGKTRLGLTHRKNHWWFITIYVSARGFSTFTIPLDKGLSSLEIELDVLQKAVTISHSEKGTTQIKLESGLTVAHFYKRYMGEISKLGLTPKFIPKPFDMGIDKPFEELEDYSSFDWNAIRRFWQLMQWNNSIFKEFSGRFYGKTCPVQIYWHHMDLAVTRFSGKKLPPMDKSVRISDRDAYSHEQISCGFWVGDDTIPEPMYYSYTYPSPEGLDKETLKPESAKWADSNGSPMALLSYDDVRSRPDPRQAVLDFLESSYLAGAELSGWKVKELTTPSLKDV